MDHQTAAPISLLRDERGQIIGGWLAKLAILIAVLGFVVIEGGAIILNNLGVREAAGNVASDVAFAVQNPISTETAPKAAERSAKENRVSVVKLDYDVPKKLVIVTVRRQAGTLVMHRVDRLRKYTVETATATRPY